MQQLAFRSMVIALTACAGLPFGCAGHAAVDGGADGGPQLTVVEMCERLASARCGLLNRCYPAFAREALVDCRHYEQTRCLDGYQALRTSFEANRVELNVEAILRCEVRLGQSSCPPSFPPAHPGGFLAPFADCELGTGLLRGKVPAGETCDTAVECAAGTVCVTPGGVCRGICSTAPQENEPCAFGCAAGFRCDLNGTEDDTADDRCVALKPLNTTCSSSAECASDLVCVGTCRPRAKLGETCRLDKSRLSTCEPGLACDVTPFVSSSTGQCVIPQGLGASCQFHWSCQAGLICARDWAPFPTMAPGPGICSQPQALGAPCTGTPYTLFVGDMCEPGSYCDDTQHTCVTPPKLGEPCLPSLQNCAGVNMYCKPVSGDQGVCVGKVSQGERCAFDLDATRTVVIPCGSGYCDKQTTQTCRAAHKALNEMCESAGECLSNRCAVQSDRTLRCANPC
ncbi:MAG: hypothetical protein K1X64_03745 [Myxococcaceae bacterium]|nr:hypothetical protein [Myxococcaceae bacterium]